MLFRISIYYNFISICKKIIDYYPNILENEQYFNEVCNSGNLEISKYMYSKIKNYQLIINYEELFISVCKNNKIDVAEWLLSINDDMNNKDFLGFTQEFIVKMESMESTDIKNDLVKSNTPLSPFLNLLNRVFSRIGLSEFLIFNLF